MTTRRREKEKTAVLFHHASVTPLRRKPNDVCTISFSTSFSSSANSALLLVLVVQSQSLLSQKQGKLELSERLKLFMEFLKHPNIFENFKPDKQSWYQPKIGEILVKIILFWTSFHHFTKISQGFFSLSICKENICSSLLALSVFWVLKSPRKCTPFGL